MLTRRDVLGTGFLGAVRPAPSAAHETVQALDREGLREISREIQALRTTFISVSSAHELPSPLIDRLREQMAQFLRSSGKFPDFCDVGYDVFYNVYDWHVKNGQELSVGRLPDGRYAIQFMFTRMILRPETEATFVGFPYDNR